MNVRSVFTCFQQAAKQFIKQGTGGKLISASSITGIKGYGNLAAYGSTKVRIVVFDSQILVTLVACTRAYIWCNITYDQFAIRGLTQAAAEELGPHGITANCYAPGIGTTDCFHVLSTITLLKANFVFTVATEMNVPVAELLHSMTGAPVDEAWTPYVQQTAVGRMAKPEDIAHVVSFLASRASDCEFRVSRRAPFW